MSGLREIRLTRIQLLGVAAVSAAVTALIIADAVGRTSAQTAALEALRHRPVVVEHHPALPAAAVASAQPSAPVSPPLLAAATPGPAATMVSNAGGASATASAPSAAPSPAPSQPQSSPPTSTAARHRVKHVFVIALSTTSFDAAFGQASLLPYLAGTLRPKGTLLAGYRTLGASELPDYLAMISGQAPNPDTQGECTTYAEFPAGAAPDAQGVVPGAGCVYPNTVLTIGDQVTAAGHGWRGYIEDMGTSTCVHPNSGAVDATPLPGSGAGYDTRHNPFIYFHSLLDLGGCAANDVSLTQLPIDLSSASTAPAYAFIAPQQCLDASASSCPDGSPAGMAGEDGFLRQWVPRILHSAAYRHGGVLVIAFAHAYASASATGTDAPVRTGALVLSPYTTPGRRVSASYNPYSLLRSVEGLLGYAPLADAKQAGSFVGKALARLG